MGWWQPFYKVSAKMVSSVLQVPILPAVFPLFLPQPDQSAFFFFLLYLFHQNFVCARLEGGGKRVCAEPVWTSVVGPCTGGLSGRVGWKGCLCVPKVLVASSPCVESSCSWAVKGAMPLERGCRDASLIEG